MAPVDATLPPGKVTRPKHERQAMDHLEENEFTQMHTTDGMLPEMPYLNFLIVNHSKMTLIQLLQTFTSFNTGMRANRAHIKCVRNMR
jgi:hypothetical protein